jgi:hypothetical protein
MSSTPTTSLNQIDVTQVKAFVDRVSAAPELAKPAHLSVTRSPGRSRRR